MCLFKKHRFPKKADVSITVYKLLIHETDLDKNAFSIVTPFRGRYVSVGSTIKSACHSLWGIFTNRIEATGVHSFSTIEQALHERRHFIYSSDIYVYRAVIPKGSWYYEGIYNDIASSSLIIKDLIPSYCYDKYKFQYIKYK